MKLILEMLLLTNRQLFFKEKHHQSTCQHEQKYTMITYILIRLDMEYNHNRYVIFNI